MSSVEAEALRPIFASLVARLQPDDIVDELYQAKLLTRVDYEGIIRDMSDQRGVNRRILMAVSNGSEGAVVKFAGIVKTSQSDLAGDILRARFETVATRTPKPHSVSTSAAITPTNESLGTKHLHEDGDNDVFQSPLTSSPPPQPFTGTSDAADPEGLPPTGQSVAQEDRVAALERKLEVAYSRIKELSLHVQELSSRLGPEAFLTAPLLHDGLTLHSGELPDLPIPTACATAVIIGRKVYVCGGRCPDVESSRRVLVYDLDKRTWSILPGLAPQYKCQAVAIDNQLVLLGGWESSPFEREQITNLVSTWTGQNWQQVIPAMPTKRYRHGVVAHGSIIAVAGGRAEDNRTLLSSIDVLDTTTRQWYTPANLQLPQPMYAMTLTANSISVNVAAARIDDLSSSDTKTPSKSVWQLPMSALTMVPMMEGHSPPCQWTEIEPTPNFDSAVLQGAPHFLAIGGDDDSDRATTHVAVCSRSKWFTVGQLLVPRARCAILSINTSSILVCGGYSDTRDKSTLLNSVELLTVHR